MPLNFEYEIVKFVINMIYFTVGVTFLTVAVGFFLRRWGAPFREAVSTIEQSPLALSVFLVGILGVFAFLISVFFS